MPFFAARRRSASLILSPLRIHLELPVEERQAVEKHLRFARSLQIETRILGGIDIARTVVEFARRNQVTQIFVAHSHVGLLERLRGKNFTEDIVRLAQDLQVTVVADRSRKPALG
jgi:two-component system sensor histidine kinase KdpD